MTKLKILSPKKQSKNNGMIAIIQNNSSISCFFLVAEPAAANRILIGLSQREGIVKKPQNQGKQTAPELFFLLVNLKHANYIDFDMIMEIK